MRTADGCVSARVSKVFHVSFLTNSPLSQKKREEKQMVALAGLELSQSKILTFVFFQKSRRRTAPYWQAQPARSNVNAHLSDHHRGSCMSSHFKINHLLVLARRVKKWLVAADCTGARVPFCFSNLALSTLGHTHPTRNSSNCHFIATTALVAFVTLADFPNLLPCGADLSS